MTIETQVNRPYRRVVALLIAIVTILSTCESGEAFTRPVVIKKSLSPKITSSKLSTPTESSSFQSSSTALSTGTILDPPDGTSLGDRMKDMLGNLNLKKRPVIVQTHEEFKEVVGNEQKCFVAVMFHAKWCKSCKATLPHFYKMAKKYPDVKFVDVPVNESNTQMLRELGVKKFPFGHIYDPSRGLVEELPILRQLIPKFEAKLLTHIVKEASTLENAEKTNIEEN
jgi:thiol-disulfide isomerase/thioredoxin